MMHRPVQRKCTAKAGRFPHCDMDALGHCAEKRISVKFISPINEPRKDWYNEQEDCHDSVKRFRRL